MSGLQARAPEYGSYKKVFTEDQEKRLKAYIFGPLKHYIDSAVDNWMRMNAGKSLIIYNIPSLVAKALPQAATASSNSSGFECTGIWPLSPDIFTETDFSPVFVTDSPAPTQVPAPFGHQPNQSPLEMPPSESAIPVDGENVCVCLHVHLLSLVKQKIVSL